MKTPMWWWNGIGFGFGYRSPMPRLTFICWFDLRNGCGVGVEYDRLRRIGGDAHRLSVRVLFMCVSLTLNAKGAA